MIQLADADVRKIKCIFFQTVRDIVEIEWYGLKCNLEEKLCILEEAKIILTANENIGCANKELQPMANSFIKRYYNLCKLNLDSCGTRETYGVNVS